MSLFFMLLGLILSTWLFWKYVCLFLYQIKSPEDRKKIIFAEIKERYVSQIRNSSFDSPAKLYVRSLSDDDLLTELKNVNKCR